MSLILDALRKAEAERQRGAVPGLHAAGPAPRPAPRRPLPRAPWMLAMGLGLLLIVTWAAWAWMRAGDRPDAVRATSVQAAAAPAERAAPAPAAWPQVVSAPPAPAPTRPAAAAAPATPSPAAATAVKTAVKTAATVAPTTVPTTAPTTADPAPPAPRPAPILTQVRRLAELPPELRRELPPLQVSGSVWSEQATARFVVLDGQVLREGDAAAPGLVLVKLTPRSATLRWRDALIEVPF